jgi:hypothetical protein
MRVRTYRDENGSRNIDLVGGGQDHPWSVDLVLEAVSCFLVGGFAFALRRLDALKVRIATRRGKAEPGTPRLAPG